MLNTRFLLVVFLVAVSILFCGCPKKSYSDNRLVEGVQAFLDTPPDPSNPDLLTPEERATITNFEIYRNIVKVHLAEGTASNFWEPIGKKMVKVFAAKNRELTILSESYYAELFIPGTYNDRKYDDLYIGAVRLQNASDRTYPELGNPRLR
jgi:hypothetical protein